MLRSEQILRVAGLLLFGIASIPGASTVGAQSTGSCSRSLAESELAINNVRARIVNTGGLFYRGEPHVYNVPRFTSRNSIFAANLIVAGKVQGQIRAAATRYGEWEMWAGPLDDRGEPPSDCDVFDRVYRVNRSDLEDYLATGVPTSDLIDWPTGLGAPTLDASGNLMDLSNVPFSVRSGWTINLKDGQLPAIEGEEMVWWVMNDRGGSHKSAGTVPLGIEVFASAFAARSLDEAINNATLYRYRIRNRSTLPIREAYIGLFVDPDLGDFGDDYVGSDTLLNMAYVYNADNSDDRGPDAYGTPPPALGIVVIQGPIADSDSLDNDYDGTIDEAGERYGLSHFMSFNGRKDIAGDPVFGRDYYNNMEAEWRDGSKVTAGGTGDGTSTVRANFMYPGDPVTRQFWTEMNVDEKGSANSSGDRRFVMSTGPVTLMPGDETEFTFAIVWAIGADHLDSITELRTAARKVRDTFETGFSDFPRGAVPEKPPDLIAPAPDAPNQPIKLTLVWNRTTKREGYQVELASTTDTRRLASQDSTLLIENLSPFTDYTWRVRSENVYGFGPWSASRSFTTGTVKYDISIRFQTVRNAAGALTPPDMAVFALGDNGFPSMPCPLDPTRTCLTPTPGYQQSTNSSVWGIHAGGADSSYADFLSRITRDGNNVGSLGPFDYEIRWVGLDNGGLVYDAFGDAGKFDAGIEIWNIGIDTPRDPSDDHRMIPVTCSSCGGDTTAAPDRMDIGGDHAVSPGGDDPFSDYIYFYEPVTTRPGQDGFTNFFYGSAELGPEVMARVVFVQLNGGPAPPYPVPLPETGTVFRILTSKFPAPTLAAPGKEEQLEPGVVHFFWVGVTGGRFQIQVSRSEDFDTYEADFATNEMTFIDTLSVEGRYYWRVMNVSGDSSPVWSFDIVNGVSVTATDDNKEIPGQFALFNNYPNPFRAATTISYALPTATRVTLELFDSVGRRVRTMMDAVQTAGRREYEFGAGSLPSGVYFYTITAGEYRATRSMTVVR